MHKIFLLEGKAEHFFDDWCQNLRRRKERQP